MNVDTEALVAHMRPVLAAERDLRELALVWQMIESSAAIGCPGEAEAILGTLTDTRRRFDALQGRLIDQMVIENRAELGDDLQSNAQCAIDILVRNLYERTADVGFLATDDVVREFCAGDGAQRDARRAAMLRRLAEYQAKYSVYDDIVLLSTSGAVLLRLDTQASAEAADPALAAQALGARGYVERYGPGPLAAAGTPALLYAHAIAAADGHLLGVLVLRFRFDDEMRRIFEGAVNGPHHLALALIDADRRVIASSDAGHVPLGAQLRPLTTGSVELTSFAGREYLATCAASPGYQGYGGPPWRAVAMVSLYTAFRSRTGDVDTDVPLDNPELIAVQAEADDINRDLRRVLWNGGLLIGSEGAQAQRLKAVLRQVTVTGQRTRARVDQALTDIHRVSLARARQQAHELALLAADLMDRNLYERANDCRWWALSPILEHALAQPASADGTRAVQRVLAHINGLYTVYSQLVAFDETGRIRAVSVEDADVPWAGRQVPAHWLSAVKTLASSQAYAVTPFEPTELHADGDTYVYLAAVRSAAHRPVGGIAIVFHAARELGAMLRDLIGERAGFAAFVDVSGRVLASAGTIAPDAPLVSFEGDRAIVEQGGSHYVCARVRAPGYREFKVSDGYDNGVHAVIGLRLGAAERRRVSLADVDLAASGPSGQRGGIEVAVFQIGALRYALPATTVLEAIPLSALVRTPSAGGATLGLIEVVTPGGACMVRVVCGRQLFDVAHPARRGDGVVIVLRALDGDPQSIVGLRVDEVVAVIEVGSRSLHNAPEGLQRYSRWVAGLIDCKVKAEAKLEPSGAAAPPASVLVQLLSHERLVADLTGNAFAAAA